MTLTELKAQHPEAVQALREELRVAVTAELEDQHARVLQAARVDADAERERIFALAGIVCGQDPAARLQKVAASGVSAEVLASLREALGGTAQGTVVEHTPSQAQAMLEAIKKATASIPSSVLAAVDGPEEQDFEALVGAHMQQAQCSRGAAMQAVALAHPDAHKKWIAAQNAARK